MKYEVVLTCDGITFIPCFQKIVQMVQKLKEAPRTQALIVTMHRQHRNFVSPIPFLVKEEQTHNQPHVNLYVNTRKMCCTLWSSTYVAYLRLQGFHGGEVED
jgi:hypothetical protein